MSILEITLWSYALLAIGFCLGMLVSAMTGNSCDCNDDNENVK